MAGRARGGLSAPPPTLRGLTTTQRPPPRIFLQDDGGVRQMLTILGDNDDAVQGGTPMTVQGDGTAPPPLQKGPRHGDQTCPSSWKEISPPEAPPVPPEPNAPIHGTILALRKLCQISPEWPKHSALSRHRVEFRHAFPRLPDRHYRPQVPASSCQSGHTSS